MSGRNIKEPRRIFEGKGKLRRKTNVQAGDRGRCFLQSAGEGTVPGIPGTNSNKKRFLNANSNMSGTIWSFSSKCMYTSSLVVFMVIITARFKSVLMKVFHFGICISHQRATITSLYSSSTSQTLNHSHTGNDGCFICLTICLNVSQYSGFYLFLLAMLQIVVRKRCNVES